MALAHFASSAINPILVIFWLVALVSIWKDSKKGPVPFAVASVAGLVICVLAVHVVRLFHVWQSHPMFPSGHEAFGASLATSIALGDRRFAAIAIVLALVLAPSLVIAGFHKGADVIASLIVCPALTLACHYSARQATGAFGASI